MEEPKSTGPTSVLSISLSISQTPEPTPSYGSGPNPLTPSYDDCV
jgi:hypothetical protein